MTQYNDNSSSNAGPAAYSVLHHDPARQAQVLDDSIVTVTFSDESSDRSASFGSVSHRLNGFSKVSGEEDHDDRSHIEMSATNNVISL